MTIFIDIYVFMVIDIDSWDSALLKIKAFVHITIKITEKIECHYV